MAHFPEHLLPMYFTVTTNIGQYRLIVNGGGRHIENTNEIKKRPEKKWVSQGNTQTEKFDISKSIRYIFRNRSPVAMKRSRSPSYSRSKHYSSSPSRNSRSKRHKSRSPRREKSPRYLKVYFRAPLHIEETLQTSAPKPIAAFDQSISIIEQNYRHKSFRRVG